MKFHFLDESHHTQVRLLARAAERFAYRMVRDWREKGTWLVVSGQTGCGKSHVARAIARFWDSEHVDAYADGRLAGLSHLGCAEFINWALAVQCEADEWKEWLYSVRQARVVIVDDVGAESDRYKSGVPAERLLALLNSIEKKWVVITTNIQAENWAKRFDQRIADRLNAAAHVDMFAVPSYRGRK